MIFGPALLPLVLDGRKTMTRRPQRPGEILCRYRIGRDYAVQPGRARPAVARMLVEDVRLEPLGAIGEDDAQREGFASRAEFEAYWRHLYGGRFDEGAMVWVIAFALCDACAYCGRATRHRYTIDLDLPAYPACDGICATLVLQRLAE